MERDLRANGSEIDIEVRYAETDQMGVVHHANYLVWFELARTHLCAESGFSYAAIEDMGYWLMVIHSEVDYQRGARYGETVRVSARIERLTSRTLRFAYQVSRGGESLARGATEHVWVSRERRRPCRIPEALREPFSRLAGEA